MAENRQTTDPSHDLLGSRRQPLDAIFSPETVAVIGASEDEGSVGRTLLWNLISNPFGGTVFPVNPNRKSVLGINAYDRLADIPEQVDLAVIATPATTVPGIVEECVEAGVRGAIIVSAGFREIGEEGAQLEQQIKDAAANSPLRIIGPNCLGVMRPISGLNATFAESMARPGSVGFISQSGALLTAILDWSFRENVGFSAFASIGSMVDVDWGDLIYYLGDDSRTKSILLYMESIGDARSFLSAAREVAFNKPIIVIKAGRTKQAAEAAASHTGAMTGSDEVLNAAFRRAGVLRVDSIADLFYLAETLAKQPRPSGRDLTIVTNAGGPGVLATDALIQGGGELTTLSDETMASFDEILPAHWSHSNPVDILGDATPKRYADSVDIVQQDPNTDGLLVILTPQDMTEPTQIAEQLRSQVSNPSAESNDIPVLASWMGGPSVSAGESILNDGGVPTFGYPDTAARVFNYMWQYSYNLRALYETPMPVQEQHLLPARKQVRELIADARADGRTVLSEHVSKQILSAYGIPMVETRIASSTEEAVSHANDMGFPVVAKLHSNTITHKAAVGGVMLNLCSPEEVHHAFKTIQEHLSDQGKTNAFGGVSIQPMIEKEGYELIIGSSPDPQFGPILLFGSGGSLVEIYQDRALGLPPLNTTLARRMMEQTDIYSALTGDKGNLSVNLDAVKKLLVRFSQLVTEQILIKEIDINPLLATPDQLIGLDARVILYPAEQTESDVPRTAIRPYPLKYIGRWHTKTGTPVTIRPIAPEDEPKLVEFHKKLSQESVYLRYASITKLSQRVAHERLARICHIDYDREMALVVERENGADDDPEIVAVGRLTKLPGTNDGEFAILVLDDYQQEGIGTELLRRLVEVGREEGLDRIVADILSQNKGMQTVSKKLGFKILEGSDPSDPVVQAVKVLEDNAVDEET